jgi:D-glycero-D-manno-heptose 1,7-bisphosphate phosphatase
MKKAIIMDRDGTLIQEVGYLKMIEDMRFTPRATDALRIFHDLGYLNIVVTNQSAVARGLLSPKELSRIHRRLKELAAEEGAVVDAVYCCPHHPEGRMAPFNVECDCRKPRPGMIIQARDKHRLDLSQCYLVGDKVSDLQLALARNAGVRPVLVLTGYGTQTREQWPGPAETYASLYEFAWSLKAAAEAAVTASEGSTGENEGAPHE